MADITMANIIGWTIFGAIGFVAFVYGKKQSEINTMIIGFVLMAYPYFVANTLAMYAVGVALTAALFIFRD